MFEKIYQSLFKLIRANGPLNSLVWNDRLTARIWGIEVHDKLFPMTWDLTTLCLKKAIDAFAPSGGFRALDMGCGQLGLLGQYMKKTRPDCEVTSLDIYPEFVENARLNARANGLEIGIAQSDLFEAVSKQFDVITFNPPYVPEDRADSEKFRKIAYSGDDGTETTIRFLEGARERLASGGRIFLGINCFFVPESRCLEIFEEAGYRVDEIVRRPLNTARAFVLSPGRS